MRSYYNVEIPQQPPISQTICDKIKKRIYGRNKYIISDADRTFVAELGPDPRLINLAEIMQKDKSINDARNFRTNEKKCVALFESGIPLGSISERYGVPPLMLAKSVPANKRQEALAAALKIDISPDADKKTAAVALEQEKKIVGYFLDLGIKLKTQDDLIREQTEIFGRPVLTPDILFLSVVYINGWPVTWLEFKDYVGHPSGPLYASARNQTLRYTVRWGGGVICYGRGIVEGTDHGPTLVISSELLGL